MIRFTKMHGLGNDFVVFETAANAKLPSAERWRAWSNRKTGIGFDQALVIQPARNAETLAYYRIFNADGGEVEQCGNGVRCVAEWLRRQRKLRGPIRLESCGGVIEARFENEGLISVDMGEPQFLDAEEIELSIGVATVRFTRVSMGNPISSSGFLISTQRPSPRLVRYSSRIGCSRKEPMWDSYSSSILPMHDYAFSSAVWVRPSPVVRVPALRWPLADAVGASNPVSRSIFRAVACHCVGRVLAHIYG